MVKERKNIKNHERAYDMLAKERFHLRRTAAHKDGAQKIIIMGYSHESARGVDNVGDGVDKMPELKWSTFTLSVGDRKLKDRIDHPTYDEAMKHFESCHIRGKWSF